MRRELPVISLFSGVGGLDLGLSKAGFTIRLQIDSDPHCCQSLRLNKDRYWPKSMIIEGRVEDWPTDKLLEKAGLKVGEAVLVCGGTPCQPFSKSAFWSRLLRKDGNRRRFSSGITGSIKSFRRLNDPRAGLIKEFARVVVEAKPAAYLLENVVGLAYKTSRHILEEFIEIVKEAGYSAPSIEEIRKNILNAADYGVPQKRERLIIIGARDGIKLQLPEPTHADRNSPEVLLGVKRPYVTAGEAIGDLDDGTVREDERVEGKWGHLLPEIPPGGNYLFFTKERGYTRPIFKWRSRYWSFLLKLSPDMPAWTIQAQPGPYVGPFHWNNRRLRIEEIKRLQTFPDDYGVYGDRRAAHRQLGNAVPPLLAQRIGEEIIRQLSEAGLLN
jgi:DNA (cytosine-5)-methyltransferase 1